MKKIETFADLATECLYKGYRIYLRDNATYTVFNFIEDKTYTNITKSSLIRLINQ